MGRFGQGSRPAKWLSIVALLCASSAGCAMDAQGGEPSEGEVGLAVAPLTSYGKLFQIVDASGKGLARPSSGSTLALETPSTSNFTRRGFVVNFVGGTAPSTINSGNTVRIVDNFGQAVRHSSSTATLGTADAQGNWRIESTLGSGAIELEERFRLRATDTLTLLRSNSTNLIIRDSSANADGLDQFRLGCYFGRGSRTTNWTVRPTFRAATSGPGQMSLPNAVAWLKANSPMVTHPFGRGPLVTWTDPSFPVPTQVSYLVDDSLWAAHALSPYDSAFSTALRNTLITLGHYGDGLHEVLFANVGTLPFKILDADAAHFGLRGECGVSNGTVTQLRVPTLAVDQLLTNSLTAGFADAAVYQILNDFWANPSANRTTAQNRIKALIDPSSGPNDIFWDSTRRVLVDGSTRGDYNSGINRNYNFKLALVVYAAKVVGLAHAALAQMRARLRDGQTFDGGIAHSTVDDIFGNPFSFGATGEATAAAILAHSVNTFP